MAKTKEVLAAGPDAGLAIRRDLAALHEPAGFGGFVTAGLFDALRAPDDAAAPTKLRALLDTLSVSPALVAVPVSFALSGAGAGVELRGTAPRDVVRMLGTHFR